MSDMNGTRYMRWLTCAVVFASASAFDQVTKVTPISNTPT